MPKTVNSAFNKFLSEKVNLDPAQTDTARRSRDWLISQINCFSDDKKFPLLYTEKHIPYGSFARRTKIRPLNDIDLMICLKGQGGRYDEHSDKITITVLPNSNLVDLCHDGTLNLNSRKVQNRFISNLSSIYQYSSADIRTKNVAVTLKLSTYTWVFDIVPCFFTSPEANGKQYYLIPDGKGNWQKTDPVIDRQRTTAVNQKHNNNILNIIRIIKYWNNRPTMPSMSSYLLETMICNYYESYQNSVLSYVDMEIPNILDYIGVNIFNTVNDPKNIQGNINNVSYENAVKISNRASSDAIKARQARAYEIQGNHEKSINKWEEVFGNEFPKYNLI